MRAGDGTSRPPGCAIGHCFVRIDDAHYNKSLEWAFMLCVILWLRGNSIEVHLTHWTN